MAREQYREAKLTIVDEATTKDGRPNWRAAVWALEKAFPQDYGRPPRPRREAEGSRPGWQAAASILENAFPQEYGDPALTGQQGAAPSLPAPQGVPEPHRELIAVLLEENEELRAQLNALVPEN
jgi:hypothetical protein